MNIYVIIVTYNGSRWVDACFNSLRRSTVPLKTVVVDNCSTDGTPDLIEARFPEVHLIRSNENLGFGRGNNRGIEYAIEQGADYVFLLNQDAWIFPDTMERLLAACDEQSGIVSPVHLDGTGHRMDEGFKYYVFGNRDRDCDDQELLAGFKEVKEVSFVNAAAWLLPIKTVLTIGGFDPVFYHYGEDNNYCNRVLCHSLQIKVVPGSLICHDRQGTNRPMRNAWVTRYLLIIYSDPRFTTAQVIRRTFMMQTKLLIMAFLYLFKGDTTIFKAYKNLFIRWRELKEHRQKNQIAGSNWLTI